MASKYRYVGRALPDDATPNEVYMVTKASHPPIEAQVVIGGAKA